MRFRQKAFWNRYNFPQQLWDEIPATIGKPVGLPLKDPKKFWVGTMLEPYGIIYQPKLLSRLGVEIKDWDDLLNPKLKGQIAQCTPDRSSSSHASYEVILFMHGWEKGWDWIKSWLRTQESLQPDLVTCRAFVAKGGICGRLRSAQLHGLCRGPWRV